MATKKFIVEVEEGDTLNCESCPLFCKYCAEERLSLLQCTKYNLATMKIKELEEEK